MTKLSAYRACKAVIPGIYHTDLGIDGQDSGDYTIALDGSYAFAVISDGCGSASKSDIGSNLLTIWTMDIVAERIEDLIADLKRISIEDLDRFVKESELPVQFRPHYGRFGTRRLKTDLVFTDDIIERMWVNTVIWFFLKEVYEVLLAKMLDYVTKHSPSGKTKYTTSDEFAREYLAASVLSVIVTDRWTIVFYAGDGAYRVGSIQKWIEKDDKPPYPVYQILENRSSMKGGVGKFEYRVFPAARSREVLIATDGCEPFFNKPDYLLRNKDLSPIPDRVGNLAQFFDPYYDSDQKLHDRLNLLVQGNRMIDYPSKSGRLIATEGFRDDLCMVVIRRLST